MKKFIVLLTAKNSSADFSKYTDAEVEQVTKLYAEGNIAELYLQTDKIRAILIMRANDQTELASLVGSLPMVKAGLFDIDYLPISPWPQIGRVTAALKLDEPLWTRES